MDLLEQLEPWWPYALYGIVVLGLVIWLMRRDAAAARDRAAMDPAAKDSAAKDSASKAPAVKSRPVKKAPAKTAAPPGRKPAGTQPPPVRSHVLILAREEHATKLCEAIAMPCVRVKSAAELVSTATRQRPAAVFVDVERLPELDGQLASLPIVGVLDEASETLPKIVHLLRAHPSLAHLIAAPLLSTLGRTHLKTLVERLANGPEHDLLDTASVGRVAMLAQSGRREARFERMQEYFSKQGLSSRTIAAIYEVAEELVMNALYNAPTEAGYFKTPVSRMEEVTLPLDRACEVSYGMEAGNAFVRLRDTFGSLRHERLLEVLNRCNASEVTLDESRGGAGLGIWRVFMAATTIAITVIPGRLTDILIRMAPRQGKSARQLLAVDLFFLPDSGEALSALLLEQDSSLVDKSITIIQN